MTRPATAIALLLAAATLTALLGPRWFGPARPPLPAVELAWVHSAPTATRTPGVILTVTPHAVELDGTAVLADPRGEVQPLPDARSSYDLRAVVAGDAGDALRTQLERLLKLAGLAQPGASREGRAHLRLRIARDVRVGDLQQVMLPALRAGHLQLELEVATDTGLGHLTFLPYTFCACPLPPTPSWCAAPELSIAPGGVTVVATPDLTPPIGCHKAIGTGDAPDPPFRAEVDWRGRVIAGPEGGCPSAQVRAGGLDVAALASRLAAVRRAAPGCGWAAVEGRTDVPWSVVAPAMAALYAEFGRVRVFFGFRDDLAPPSAGSCANALPLSSLTPQAEASPLRLGRRGCSD